MHLNGIAWPSQDTAVGEDLALDIEESRPGSSRLHNAAQCLTGKIRKQDFPLVGRVPDSTLSERSRKDLALRLQRLDLLADKAGLVLAEVKKAASE